MNDTVAGCQVPVPTVHGAEEIPRGCPHSHHHRQGGAECRKGFPARLFPWPLALCETDSSFFLWDWFIFLSWPLALCEDWFVFFLGHWPCVRLIHHFTWLLALRETDSPFYLYNHKINPVLCHLCKKALNKMEEEQKASWCKCMLFIGKYLFLCCAIRTSQIPPRRH